jgi:hypothetical protein
MPNVLVNTSVSPACYDIEDLFGTAVGANFSLDEVKAMKCSTAMIWAKEHGIDTHPEFYKNITGLKANSSWADYQCALFTMKGGAQAGTGWNCTYPCTSTLPECPAPTLVDVDDKDLAGAGKEPEEDAGSGFPWWAGLLIAVLVIGLIAAGIMYAMGMCGAKETGKRAPKKKKRATKPAEKATPAPAPEPAPAPPAAPAVMTAPPVYVSQAQPMAMAAPAVSYAMAAPVQTVATPVASVAAPVPMYTAVPAAPMYTVAAPTYATYAAPEGLASPTFS